MAAAAQWQHLAALIKGNGGSSCGSTSVAIMAASAAIAGISMALSWHQRRRSMVGGISVSMA